MASFVESQHQDTVEPTEPLRSFHGVMTPPLSPQPTYLTHHRGANVSKVPGDIAAYGNMPAFGFTNSGMSMWPNKAQMLPPPRQFQPAGNIFDDDDDVVCSAGFAPLMDSSFAQGKYRSSAASDTCSDTAAGDSFTGASSRWSFRPDLTLSFVEQPVHEQQPAQPAACPPTWPYRARLAHLAGNSAYRPTEVAAPPSPEPQQASLEPRALTTVMLQHIDYSHTEESVYRILQQNGLSAGVDALYAPRNRKKGTNLGYVFVNFVAPELAVECISRLDGQFLSALPTERACRAAYAKRQGEDFLNHCQDDIWRPCTVPPTRAAMPRGHHATNAQVWGRLPAQ